MRSITVADLLDRLDRDQVTYLLDVRTPEEFDAWHIRGAVNLPLQDLPHHLNRIPRTAEVFTICAAASASSPSRWKTTLYRKVPPLHASSVMPSGTASTNSGPSTARHCAA